MMQQAINKKVQSITAAQFVQEVAESTVPVLLTFTAGGCSSCGKMLGTLETIIKIYDGRIKFVTIDSAQAGPLLLNYRRGGTPLSLLLVNGKVAKSPLIGTQESNFPNEAVWLGNAMYIQYFIQFLDSCLHAVNTKQLVE